MAGLMNPPPTKSSPSQVYANSCIDLMNHGVVALIVVSGPPEPHQAHTSGQLGVLGDRCLAIALAVS